jgi:hypothetical protein
MWTLPALLLTIGFVETSSVGGSISLDASVGAGTFVAYDKADDPLYASTLTIEPTWSFEQYWTAAISVAVGYEWTYLVTSCDPASGPRAAGAPSRDCSDTNDANGRRASLSDIELSLTRDEIYRLELFSVRARGSVALPTSRESRHTDNVLTLGAGITAGFDLSEWAPVSFDLGFSINKFFPTAQAAQLEEAEAEAIARGGVPVIRCATSRNSCILLSGFVPTWRTGIDLTAKVDAPWVEGLSATVSFGYQYSRRFGRDPDGSSSTKTDLSGSPVVDGTSDDDTTSGLIELGYAIDENVSVSLGVASQQPAKTADGKRYRFPFYDFISPGNNYSAWYVSGSFSL